MALVSAISLVINYNHKESSVSDAFFEVEVNRFLDSLNSNSLNNSGGSYGSGDVFKTPDVDSSYSKKRFTPFPFDPNTANKEDWVKMGFSEKQAKVILKYRGKGGKFYNKEDFKKLFIIDDDTYKIFEPYITIDKRLLSGKGSFSETQLQVASSGSASTQLPLKPKTVIEINSADSAELTKIYGIGPVFASRIIKYREKLGGFYFKSQLREVYGIDSIRYTQIEDQVIVDTNLVRFIHINSISLNDLRKCPYLDYYLAKKIIDKRIQKGEFRTLVEIGEILSTKPEVFKKVLPYIVL
jgi:competence ComEA-like helix-hairpin-helix protein